MTKKVIGILGNQVYQYVEFFHGNHATYTPQGFVDGVKAAGATPVVIPLGDAEEAENYVSMVDGLIFAGGQDVSPQIYGEVPSPKIGETFLPRDLFEEAILNEALAQNKPIFAVCRGMQLINAALGGTLYQDLSEYPKWRVKHEQAPTIGNIATHKVQIAENSPLFALLGSEHMVNSYHHQGIKDLALDLIPIAWSDDELVEGIMNKKGNLLGVQWHPELNFHEDEKMFELFKYFVEKMVRKTP